VGWHSTIIPFIIIFLAGCNLSTGEGGGPATWIDRPLEGEVYPPTPITILAHASDTDGVAKIEFLVDGKPIGSVPTGGARLEQASLEWTPPAPGVYTISVIALDTLGNGNARAPSTVQITISGGGPTPTPSPAFGQCNPEALTAPMLLSPADGEAVAGDPLFSWSYPDSSCHPYSYKVDISTDASFADSGLGFGTLDHNETSRSWPLPPGGCYYWRVNAYVPDVDGPPSDAWRFCLELSTTDTPSVPTFTLLQNANCRKGPGTAYDSVDTLTKGATVVIEGRSEDSSWLRVVRPAGSGHCWVSAVTGTVSGNLAAVTILPAPPLPTAVIATPTLDIDPPLISDVSATPVMISAQVVCGATPATTVITARVSDPGGLARVTVRVSGVGDFDMASAGGDIYQVMLGPFNEAGTLTIFVQAQDPAGNTATSAPIEVQVVTCPG
jgi:hypothetical protein